jgi:hypothetical protein
VASSLLAFEGADLLRRGRRAQRVGVRLADDLIQLGQLLRNAIDQGGDLLSRIPGMSLSSGRWLGSGRSRTGRPAGARARPAHRRDGSVGSTPGGRADVGARAEAVLAREPLQAAIDGAAHARRQARLARARKGATDAIGRVGAVAEATRAAGIDARDAWLAGKHVGDDADFIASLRRDGPVQTLQLSFVVQANNWREMPEFVDPAARFGADRVLFSGLRDWSTFSGDEHAAGRCASPLTPSTPPSALRWTTNGCAGRT